MVNKIYFHFSIHLSGVMTDEAQGQLYIL